MIKQNLLGEVNLSLNFHLPQEYEMISQVLYEKIIECLDEKKYKFNCQLVELKRNSSLEFMELNLINPKDSKFSLKIKPEEKENLKCVSLIVTLTKEQLPFRFLDFNQEEYINFFFSKMQEKIIYMDKTDNLWWEAFINLCLRTSKEYDFKIK